MPKLFITDERMIRLMEYAITNKIVDTERAFFDEVGFKYTNSSNLRNGNQGFTKVQILNAAKLTGCNINWLFGLEQNMMRKPGKSSLEQLKEAVTSVEQELKRRV